MSPHRKPSGTPERPDPAYYPPLLGSCAGPPSGQQPSTVWPNDQPMMGPYDFSYQLASHNREDVEGGTSGGYYEQSTGFIQPEYRLPSYQSMGHPLHTLSLPADDASPMTSNTHSHQFTAFNQQYNIPTSTHEYVHSDQWHTGAPQFSSNSPHETMQGNALGLFFPDRPSYPYVPTQVPTSHGQSIVIPSNSAALVSQDDTPMTVSLYDVELRHHDHHSLGPTPISMDVHAGTITQSSPASTAHPSITTEQMHVSNHIEDFTSQGKTFTPAEHFPNVSSAVNVSGSPGGAHHGYSSPLTITHPMGVDPGSATESGSYTSDVSQPFTGIPEWVRVNENYANFEPQRVVRPHYDRPSSVPSTITDSGSPASGQYQGGPSPVMQTPPMNMQPGSPAGPRMAATGTPTSSNSVPEGMQAAGSRGNVTPQRLILPRQTPPGVSFGSGPSGQHSNFSQHHHDRGPIIPQECYYIPGNSHSFCGQEPIVFNFKDLNARGIPVIDALEDKRHQLIGSEDRISTLEKSSVTLRILWPGYPAFSNALPAMNWKKKRTHLTREGLARKVASQIAKFYEQFCKYNIDPDSISWKLGADGIQLADIVLLSLRHVSQGSWQPELCLRNPRP